MIETIRKVDSLITARDHSILDAIIDMNVWMDKMETKTQSPELSVEQHIKLKEEINYILRGRLTLKMNVSFFCEEFFTPSYIHVLKMKIDDALDKKDRALFQELTAHLNYMTKGDNHDK